MEAKEYKVIDILTENKKYFIPPYQRPYCWERENAEALLDDLISSFEEDDSEYFIGTLICIHKGDEIYEVVDGQQRLTTLSLIFAALKELIKKSKARENLQKRILPIDDFSDRPQEPRLTVRKKEQNLYVNFILKGDGAFLPEAPSFTERLFIENYSFIREYLIRYPEDILCQFAKYILERVYVVFVKTDSFISSYRLFNVLNARGMPLTNSDLLKNQIFEATIDADADHKRVEDCWLEVENAVGINELDKFLKINRMSKKQNRDRVLKGSVVDAYMKELREQHDNDPLSFVNSLLRSAKNYQKIKECEFSSPQVYKAISSLLLLPDEWVSAVLAFMNKMNQGHNQLQEHFTDFIQIFEKSYMHGWFMNKTKGEREAVCFSALVSINNNQSINSIIQSIKNHANNDALLSALDSPLYDVRKTKLALVKSMLMRIDQEMQDESVVKSYRGRVSIEHILPQSMKNTYWQERFSPEEHEYWVHRLGNLTLLTETRNSQASNFDFCRKIEVYKQKLKKASFDITKSLFELEDWTIEELKERHNELVDWSKEIWLV